jgi:DNA-binding SARP family transcriptional activator
MIELRVLGSLSLRASDGKDRDALVRQSKRMALLVYLAAAPHGFHRRDTLLALFWPELPDARARGALNQALYVLRTTLGDNAILTRGDDEVGVNDAAITCDAVRFENAVEGRPEEALTLYRGDFLEGFFVPDAPAFEQWVETERARLRNRASESAWSVAESHAAAGRAVEAVRWARRASDFTPADEAVARRLMTFLHRIGDRAAAVRSYEAFVWQLSKEYELEPSSETQALALALREDATSVKRVQLESAPAILVAIRERIPFGWAALFLGLTLLAGGAWTWLSRDAPSPRAVVRFTLSFPDAPPMAGGVPGTTIALTPDESRMVYVATTAVGRELFQRPLDQLASAVIPNTRAAYMPFFSPDGKWLAFVADGAIRKVPATGGPAITICAVEATVYGASWGANDVIVFATPAGIWRVAATRGTPPRLIASADTLHAIYYRWPEVLPEGKAAILTIVDGAGFHLAVASLETGVIRRLGVEGTNPHFLASGHLVFGRRDGVLYAAAFDPRALTISARPEPMEEGVIVGMHGGAKLGISATGTIAYMPEQVRERALVTVTRAGKVETLPLPMHGYHAATYSHDGRRIAAVVHAAAGSRQDIWIVDPARQTLDRLTHDEGSLSPTWSADDKAIVYATTAGGQATGFVMKRISVDGGDSATTLLPGEHGLLPVDAPPRDSVLIVQRVGVKTARDIWYWMPGRAAPTAYLRTPFDERAAAISPDGKWMAYKSNESGADEIYVRSFPTPGEPLRVSLRGGNGPRWAANGRELFYRGAEGLVAVTLATAPAMSVVNRQVLFDASPFFAVIDGGAYDVHPDGQRFLMIRRGRQSNEVVVALNLFDRLVQKE